MGDQVYVGLGGNIGDPVSVFNRAINEIGKLPNIFDLRCSNFYQTTPVGFHDQADFVNAMLGFKTTLTIQMLRGELRRIEELFGKVARPKDHPRVLDLDLILFGRTFYEDGDYRVPHRSWEDRLFVLKPFCDLVHEIEVPRASGFEKINLLSALENFSNKHNETVNFLTEPKMEHI